MIFRKKKPPETSRRRPVQQDTSDTKVYNYYRTSHTERTASQPVKNHRNRAIFDKIKNLSLARWLIVIAILFLCGMLIAVDTSPIIRLGNNDRPVRDVTAYRNGVKDILSGSIVNRTKLSFDYTAVRRAIMERYPEVSDVSIHFDLIGRKPVVSLSLHQPTLRVESKGVVWIVDDRGVVISRDGEVNISDAVQHLPLITDEINIGGEVGKPLLSPEDTTFIGNLLAFAQAQRISISHIFIPLVPKQIDMQVEGENYRVKLNTDEDVKTQYGTWMAARETLQKRGEIPTEYIDVRAGEKVFWK